MNRKHEAEHMPSPRKNLSENRMYYEKLADKYHIIQYIPLAFLAVFSVLAVFFGYRSMQADHFRYLLKSLTDNPVALEEKYEDISYAAGSGVDFALYKDDLAVIGDSKMAIYTLSGDLRFRHSAKSTGEAYAVSEKYIAVYTPGGKGISVYNSFGCVFEETFKVAIRSVSVSDSGRFAVCLKGDTYTQIEVFDLDFEPLASFRTENGVVYDMDMSPNGDKLVVTSLATAGGAYYTELSVWDVSSEKILMTEKIDGKKPIAAGFFEDGRFFVAVQGNIFFYQPNGKKAETVSLNAQEYAVVCDGETLSVLRDGVHVSTYSKRGNSEAEFKLSEKAFFLKQRGELYYTVSDLQIAVYDEDGVCLNSFAIASGLLDFFVLADGSLLLCYVSQTDRITPTY